MKNLLYVSFEDSANLASGVNKKIMGHIGAFQDEGYHVTLVASYQHTVAVHETGKDTVLLPGVDKNKFSKRKKLCGWAGDHAEKFDCCYIRFQFFCPYVYGMLCKLQKCGVKTVIEIPTYPYTPELKKQGLRGIPKRFCDALFQRVCAKKVGRFAAPLYGQPILGVDCLEIRNGIDVEKISPKLPREPDGTIHLLAVAMMAPWHGYDRVLDSLHTYYVEGGERHVILHLVGEGVETPKYKEQVSTLGLAEHVFFHGKQSGPDLEKIYDIADLGIATLGAHRLNCIKTNTLKTQEYLAKGLPIVCTDSEVGIPDCSKYKLTVSSDESAIQMKSIISFYDDIYASKPEPEKIIQNIREDCRRYCSVKNGIHAVLEYFLS